MTQMSKQKQILGLLGWLGLAFAASAAGAVAALNAGSFYAQIVRPWWAPPASVFGPVWTVLYAMMGVAAWLVWREG
ncbi:MAG: tryptophan-rich sensory protein, partial [Herminiimonas sp.]|nr:tryptophan-rich sensory protein [Herminiimonas sp.]